MTFFFGPVNSRRLGRSLGLDILPSKICSMDCLYCEVGRSPSTTCERREYIPVAQIHAAIDTLAKEKNATGWDGVDVVTVTASGEPTLHSALGEIIAHLKEAVPRPIALLTNGSLCHLPEVRNELSACDILVPSLDAATEHSFQAINRPDRNIDLDRLIGGLTDLSREYSGTFLLEILVADAINDSAEEMAALAQAIKKINPTRLQLHTVSRPPAYSTIKPVSNQRLQELDLFFNTILPGKVDCFLRADTHKKKPHKKSEAGKPTKEEILKLLQRRPSTAQDIAYGMSVSLDAVQSALQELLKTHDIYSRKRGKETFFSIHEINRSRRDGPTPT